MEGNAIANVIETASSNVGDLLQVGLDTIQTLMTNEYVLLFFSFTIVMWGIKLFHSIRKAV
jgi:hypothetical protein